MSELRDLYQATILDHSKQPKNFRKIEGASHHAEGYNPLCGDKFDVYLQVEGDKVVDVSFEGSGCAISTASASLMTQALKGKSVAHALALFHAVHKVATGKEDESGDVASEPTPTEPVEIGKLAVFEGVRQYPLRVKCATLPWHTVRNALLGKHDEVAVTE
jgi:nitrogen fixation NifU-like protein